MISKLEKRLSSEFYFIVLLPLFYDIETMMSKLEKKLSSEFHFTVPLLYDIETTMSKLEKRLSSDFWFPFHSSAFTSQWYRNQGDEQAWEETVLKSSTSQSHLTSLSLSLYGKENVMSRLQKSSRIHFQNTFNFIVSSTSQIHLNSCWGWKPWWAKPEESC